MKQRTNILQRSKNNLGNKRVLTFHGHLALWILTFASMILGVSKIHAQDSTTVLKNGGIVVNTGNKVYGEIQNYSGSTAGTIWNTGTISIKTGKQNGTLTNFKSGGTNGTVKNVRGGVGSGTIICQGNYVNGSGTTDNDSLNNYIGTIRVAGALTTTGTFDTDSGRVDYNGSTAQTILATTYGTLIASGSNTVSLPSGTTTVNDSIRIAGTAIVGVGSNTLNFTGATFTLQGSGSLNAASGTVNYSGDRNQQVAPATYLNLTTSGSTAARTKTSSGGITIAASGVLTVGTNDALAVSSGTLNLSNTGVTLNNSNSGASIKIGGAVSFVSTITSAGAFEFSGNAQTIAANTYTDLTLSGTSGTKTFGTTVKVTGNYVVTHGGTRDYTGNTFVFAATSGTQTITGLVSESFNILQLEGASLKNIAAGTLTATTLSLTSGTGAVTNNAAFTIGTGGLTINGTSTQMNNNGTITVNGDINNDGMLTNTGTITTP